MNQREDGFILVAMIWIIAILTVLTLGFAHRAMIDERAAAMALDHSKAQYYARGSVTYAVADLRNQAVMEAFNQQTRSQAAAAGSRYLQQRIAQQPQQLSIHPNTEGPNLLDGKIFAGGETSNKATYSVNDAEGRISLNTAPEDILNKIDGLGFVAVSAIMRHRGGELTPEERELFLTVEEARTLDGMDEELWEGDGDKPGLKNLFTVYGSGKININSASRDVLLTIPDLDSSVVDQIISYRAGADKKLGTSDDQYFQSLATMSQQTGIDPTNLAPIGQFCTFQSQYFTITGFATARQGKVRASAQAVVFMEPGKATMMTWSEGEFGPQSTY